jgi:hypothetical protein
MMKFGGWIGDGNSQTAENFASLVSVHRQNIEPISVGNKCALK